MTHLPLRKYTLFYKQHFYKQTPAKTGEKNKLKLSITLRLNVRYLKITRFLHPRYHTKIMEDIVKNAQTTGVVFK